MNCETCQNMILLQESGELPKREARLLADHLVECSACRHYQSDLMVMQKVIPTLTHNGPSTAIMQSIRETAANDRRRFRWIIGRHWKTALATAAGLMLCLTGIRFAGAPESHRNGMATRNGIATEFMPLAALILDQDNIWDDNSGDSALTVLADKILLIQGMDVEKADEGGSDATLPGDNLPTTLQWNSSSALPPERCV